MNILAVDDDPTILELLLISLQMLGYHKVTTCDDPGRALEMVEISEMHFDCILLDIHMPKIDGVEVCKRIREMPDYAKTPIIMVTAMSDRGSVQDAFAVGALDYLTKPFDMTELGARLGMVERMISQSPDALSPPDEDDDFISLLARSGPSDFDDPISVLGVEGVVNLDSIRNFLDQLSRSGMRGTSVFGVSVGGLEEAFECLSSADYYALLVDVARCLRNAFQDSPIMVAYAGRGKFVIVMHGRLPHNTLEISKRLNFSLRRVDTPHFLSDVLSIQPGAPVHLGQHFTRGASGRSVERALGNLDGAAFRYESAS